jgi:predicted DNA-binding transcriptional regulator AlpA
MKTTPLISQPLAPVLMPKPATARFADETDRVSQLELFPQAQHLRLLTLSEVAKMLNTSKAWVRDHATRRNPRLPVVRFGGQRAILRFRLEDIETFIAQHLVRGNSV